MPLTSARFAGVDRLERCAAGEFAARLTPSTNGTFVALVQQALMDLGEPLPQFGADGSYGTETTTAVLDYKTRHGLRSADGSIDGIVGPGTIGKLDEECTAADEVPGPCPPDSDGPVVDLAGADEQLVNMVLGRTAAATVVGVDATGATRLVGDDVKVTEPLAASLAGSSARLLVDDSAAEAAAELSAALGELAAAFAAGGLGVFADAAAEGAQWATQIVPGLQLAADLAAALGGTQPSPATPVRDLGKTAALAEAVAHAQAGRITLTPGPVTKPDGTVVMPDPKGKFTISSTVAGVTYKFTNFADRRRSNYTPAAVSLVLLDIRHVVGLVRFAMHMSARWGVTELHHVGIGGDTVRTDCHGNGRAFDFVGAAGTHDGAPFLLTVFNDWKNNSVPNLDDRTKPRRPDWPHVTRRLEYRLATLPGVNPFVRDFFADLYAWVAGEYQDRTDGPGQTVPASSIGEGSRIMTPDHPDSDPAPGAKDGREAHDAHVHWQVGPTGTQAP
jgi:peptidoglycan hydrolase-like protein with peptidoglycan-binding domain